MIEPSQLTLELLRVSTPNPASDDQLVRQIALLDVAIARERNEQKRNELCAQFQALNWVRAFDSYAPPIEE